MTLPRVQATGNLVADPELKFTNTGKPVANMRIACSKRRKNDAGEWEDETTTFLPVTAWSYTAEAAAEHLAKGQQVSVTGDLRQRTYEAQDGTQRTVYELHAYEIATPLRRQQPQQQAPQGGGNPWSTGEPAPF